MALIEIRARLNASSVMASFASDLRAPIADLERLGLPLDPGALGGLIDGNAHIDLGGLRKAVERLAQQLTGHQLQLPSPETQLASLRALIELIESLDPRGIEANVRAALSQVTATLKGPRNTGFDSTIEGILASLGASADGKAIGGVVTRLIALAGIDAALVGDLKAMVPAVIAGVRGAGAVIRIESALSEAERLTRILRAQVDASRINTDLDLVKAQLDFAIRTVRDATANPALHALAEQAVLEALEHLDVSRANIARDFAFAEATLVHLDLGATVAEVRGGLDDAAGVDLAGATAVVTRVVERVMPVLSIPLPPAPAASFDALLTLLEGKSQALAGRIEAIDVARVGAPIRSVLGKATQPLKEVERLATELTSGAHQAVQGVTSLVSSIPTKDVTDAVGGALAPVRETMTTIGTAVGAADAAVRDFATKVLATLAAAEHAVDALAGALRGVCQEGGRFLDALKLDEVVGQLSQQLRAVRGVLEQASVRPYFSAATDAIDTTADVLSKVPVIMLPDDVKKEFDALVEPIRSLNVDAVASEVEGWFALEDGKFPFEPALQAEIAQLRQQLADVVAAIEPFHPRVLVAPIDAELAPLRAQLARIDLGPVFAPIDNAVGSLKQVVQGVDPRAALTPADDAIKALGDRVREFSPSTVIAPLQARVDAARSAVIDVLHLEEASRALTDLEREAVRLVTLLDPVTIGPAIAAALDVARREVGRLDGASMSEWVGTIVTAMLGGDGKRRRPATWGQVLEWLERDDGASRLRLRARAISDAVAAARGDATGVDLAGAAASVRTRLGELAAAVAALPAGAAIRPRLVTAVARRGADGGYVTLGVNHARFTASLSTAAALVDPLVQLDLARVDVTTAALRVLCAPLTRVRGQILGTLKHFGLNRADAGLATVLADILAVATPERLTSIIVPIFTALRGRAQALLGALLGPIREALDDLVRLLKLVDLGVLTRDIDAVVEAGVAQVLALSPLRVLEPSLAAFDALKAEVQAFDPVAALRGLLDGVRAMLERLLGKLNAAALIAPAAELFDQLLETIQRLDVQPLIEPLLAALRTLAADIHGGLEQLREALKRLQAAIPSTEGLSLAGVVDVDIDVDLGF